MPVIHPKEGVHFTSRANFKIGLNDSPVPPLLLYTTSLYCKLNTKIKNTVIG